MSNRTLRGCSPLLSKHLSKAMSRSAIHIKRLVTMKGNRRVCKTKGNMRITSVSYVVLGLLEELVMIIHIVVLLKQTK